MSYETLISILNTRMHAYVEQLAYGQVAVYAQALSYILETGEIERALILLIEQEEPELIHLIIDSCKIDTNFRDGAILFALARTHMYDVMHRLVKETNADLSVRNGTLKEMLMIKCEDSHQNKYRLKLLSSMEGIDVHEVHPHDMMIYMFRDRII